MLKWTGTKEEMELLVAIARRFTGASRGYFGLSFSEVLMDLEATHCNGCALQLGELLQSEDSDFFSTMSAELLSTSTEGPDNWKAVSCLGTHRPTTRRRFEITIRQPRRQDNQG